MNPQQRRGAYDPRQGVQGAFTQKYTPEYFQECMALDFKEDIFVVRMQADRDYLCSIELSQDGVYQKAGAWDEVLPMMSIEHDYAQSRDAWEVMQKMAQVDTSRGMEEMLLDKTDWFAMPDLPPFEPRYVNEIGQTRRPESAYVREDYQKIITQLDAVAPHPLKARDHVFSAWALTPHEKNEPYKAVFHGRTPDFPGENEQEVFLRFNPLTAAGASLVLEVEEKEDCLEGTYEWNDKKIAFKYDLKHRDKQYVVCSDEWHSRLNCKTLFLLAYDLVANYDFWQWGVREKMSCFNRADRYLLRDLVLPYTFRLVEPQLVGVRPYAVKSVSRTDVYPQTQQQLQEQLSAYPLVNGEAYVMYPGSSLLHRVSLCNTVEIQGKFVRIVLDTTGDKAKQFLLSEMCFSHDKSGVYVVNDRGKASTMFKENISMCGALVCKYQSGESNAIEFELQGVTFIIFRGIWKTNILPQQYLHDLGKKDAQLPLRLFYINPEYNRVLVESDELVTLVEIQAKERILPTFTTMIPHSGTYMNRQRIVATRGLPVMDYIHACVESGMAMALRSRIDMNTKMDDFDMGAFVSVPGVRDDLYERAFAEYHLSL